MAGHTNLGREGERLAENYLQNKGFLIIERNWRFGHWEIDLIGSKDGVLHIIEVKTKRSLRGGYPEGRVSRSKFRLLQLAAIEYMVLHPQWTRIQFDIVSVIIPAGGGQMSIFYIGDVFFWD